MLPLPVSLFTKPHNILNRHDCNRGLPRRQIHWLAPHQPLQLCHHALREPHSLSLSSSFMTARSLPRYSTLFSSYPNYISLHLKPISLHLTTIGLHGSTTPITVRTLSGNSTDRSSSTSSITITAATTTLSATSAGSMLYLSQHSGFKQLLQYCLLRPGNQRSFGQIETSILR